MTDYADYAASPMPGEPSIWYHRYEIYRSLGPNRTLTDAFLRSQAELKRTSTLMPQIWSISVREWSWKARALAYDQRAVASRVAREEALQAEKLDEFRDILETVKTKLLHALDKVDYASKEVKPGTVTRLLEVFAPEFRNAYNIAEATKKSEVSGAGGDGIEINVSYTERNPNE